jgi:hypothetical protein
VKNPNAESKKYKKKKGNMTPPKLHEQYYMSGP